MWYWILKTAVVSICAIALIHHITYLLKTQLTSPKIKDLVNVDVSAGQFYGHCKNVPANDYRQNTETDPEIIVNANANAAEILKPKTANTAETEITELAEITSTTLLETEIDQGLVMFLKERLD